LMPRGADGQSPEHIGARGGGRDRIRIHRPDAPPAALQDHRGEHISAEIDRLRLEHGASQASGGGGVHGIAAAGQGIGSGTRGTGRPGGDGAVPASDFDSFRAAHEISGCWKRNHRKNP
jgi:hypothetical protein